MTDPRGVDTTPLNPPDRDDLDTLRQLAGEEGPSARTGSSRPTRSRSTQAW